MIELAIALLAVPVLCAFVEWRLGLLLCLVTAILQDPLRKLTPDQPVLFVVFVGIVFGAACVGAWVRGVQLVPSSIFGWRRELAIPFSFWVLLIIMQAANAFVHTQNVMIPLTGLLAYLLPFPSIVFGYQLTFREGERRINQFMTWYVICITLALMTVYLEFSGYNWSILGQVGPTFLVYDQNTHMQVISAAGIFRASEVAAWHAMTSACFIGILLFLRKVNLARLLIVAMAMALLMSLGALTGRRKIVVEVAVFLATYFILWLMFERGMSKLGICCIGAALAGYTWLAAELRETVPEDVQPESLNYSFYVQRTQSGFDNAPARFVELGIAPIMWAYERFGVFGAGVGMGTQGVQHFGGGADTGAAEGGLGKIVLELGIPGLLVMGWFGTSLLRHLWRIVRAASRISPRMGRLSFGLFSFLVANAAGFSVATQVYGDVFVLLILSWILGCLLAIPALLRRQVRGQAAVLQKGVPVMRSKAAARLLRPT